MAKAAGLCALAAMMLPHSAGLCHHRMLSASVASSVGVVALSAPVTTAGFVS
jgi:hypothetical protein